MMTIEIECTRCTTALSLDEGFAGGVCRCMHCGALMKVPTPARLQADDDPTRPDVPPDLSDAPAKARSMPVTATAEQAWDADDETQGSRSTSRRERILLLALVLLGMLLIAAIGAIVYLLWFGDAQLPSWIM